MVPDAVLFDLDGTLVDSAPGIGASLARTLAEFGRPAPTSGQLSAFIGPPLRQAFTALGAREAELDVLVATYRRHYLAGGVFDFTVYPGIPAVLDELAGRGVRLGVATSKLTTAADHVLAHAGLAGRFDAVVGSEPDGTRQAKSAAIAHALALLGLDDPSRAVMIGDRAHDSLGAAEAGTGFIGVSWGFADVGELARSGADLVVHSPDDLVGAIFGPEVARLTQ